MSSPSGGGGSSSPMLGGGSESGPAKGLIGGAVGCALAIPALLVAGIFGR